MAAGCCYLLLSRGGWVGWILGLGWFVVLFVISGWCFLVWLLGVWAIRFSIFIFVLGLVGFSCFVVAVIFCCGLCAITGSFICVTGSDLCNGLCGWVDLWLGTFFSRCCIVLVWSRMLLDEQAADLLDRVWNSMCIFPVWPNKFLHALTTIFPWDFPHRIGKASNYALSSKHEHNKYLMVLGRVPIYHNPTKLTFSIISSAVGFV